ncbi:hypothetical protein K488DRAFT_71883 [Vararia minispora EC-137]|uniref:Uncharacterized protein n=1 Tax=Vararia minispora EC-137 TaxID=1314806 RepID=A0ACB8QGN2_9AGAM|nr:hypothetical protein K488DRAFT_71883 [Vararia minispora EC-137]
MSDVQKVLVSLHLLSTSATGLLDALTSPSPPNPPLPLPQLHADLLRLLSLIYANTTKLTLALNPPDLTPSYNAALVPLNDLTAHLSTLASNAVSFDPREHGRALASEVQHTVKDVIIAVQELVQAHSVAISATEDLRPAGKGKGKGEEYMIKTATVHQLIERARLPGDDGISSSNAKAVRKRWNEQGDILQDAVAELDDDDRESGNDDSIGEEDEFDLSAGVLSDEEREFKKRLHAIVIRLSSAYNDVASNLLAPTSPLHPSAVALDRLLDTAVPLTRAVDDFAASVYEGPGGLIVPKKALVKALRSMAKAIDDLWGDAPPDESEVVARGSRRWFLEETKALLLCIASLRWPGESKH